MAMDSKLTLKLNKKIIERAKRYASQKDISLSRLVENYLHSLTVEQENEELEISSFVRSLATESKIPVDLDHRREYLDHLDEKYR
jgi:replicative DNA helicase